MLDSNTLHNLHELLSMHGEVVEIKDLSENINNGSHMVLVGMKSTKDAYLLQARYGFPLFGFTSVLIGDEWIKHNLENSIRVAG